LSIELIGALANSYFSGMPGVRFEGPWTAGIPYGVVPSADLVVNPTLNAAKYHVVYRGRFVGVVTVLLVVSLTFEPIICLAYYS